jgi:hypothetical protein
MRAIKATVLTVMYVSMICGMIYAEIRYVWVVFALGVAIALLLVAFMWALIYERLGHK